MKIIIPGELPDMNNIIKAAKSHYGQYSKLKKQYTEVIAWSCKGLKASGQIDLVITWHCKDKRKDKDNIAAGIKFILDGLVEGGVICNDGWKEIGNFHHIFKVDSKNPRVEIEITESEEQKQFDWGN